MSIMEFYYNVNYEKNNGELEYYGWILFIRIRKQNNFKKQKKNNII